MITKSSLLSLVDHCTLDAFSIVYVSASRSAFFNDFFIFTNIKILLC